jgi:hypothetical protein
MPNEGDILGLIERRRASIIASLPKQYETYNVQHWPTDEEKQRAKELLEKAGFAPKRFGD